MTPSSIRVVFFGTPDFAAPSLEALIKAGYTVVGVVTQPDKPVGRKQVLTPSPIKMCALENGIPVFQPKTLKKEKTSGAVFLNSFSELHADIAIVVAYGKIIPAYYLSLPRYGFVNVHGSVLPELRGPSPIHTAILRGFSDTGVTIMQLDSGMDTGATLSSRSIPIGPHDTTEVLHDQLKDIGAQLLIETLPHYIDGTLKPQPQDESRATYCYLISKEDGLLDFSDPSDMNDKKIRAYTTWPGAYCIVNGKRVKILRAHLENSTLVIDEVQPEGKKRMPYAEYLKGNAPLF